MKTSSPLSIPKVDRSDPYTTQPDEWFSIGSIQFAVYATHDGNHSHFWYSIARSTHGLRTASRIYAAGSSGFDVDPARLSGVNRLAHETIDGHAAFRCVIAGLAPELLPRTQQLWDAFRILISNLGDHTSPEEWDECDRRFDELEDLGVEFRPS